MLRCFPHALVRGWLEDPSAVIPRRIGPPATSSRRPKAHERFDKELRLKDETTRKVLEDLLLRFSRWIARERSADPARERVSQAPV